MGVRILVQPSHSQINYDDADDAEVAAAEAVLRNKFKAEDSTLRHSPAVKKGYASAVRSFYVQDGGMDPRQDKNLLPTGFLPALTANFDRVGVKYEVTDMRKWPAVDKDFLRELHGGTSFNGRVPRDYQVAAVLALVKNRGGIVQLPVGAGKTFISFLLARVYARARMLFIFNAMDLLYQTRDVFLEYGMNEAEIGVVQAKNVQDDKRVTLLMTQSFESGDDIYPHIGVVVADEAHALGSGAGAELATRVLLSCQRASVRVGFSATADCIDNPYRQMALYGNLGPIIYSKHIQEKIEDGTLAKVRVEMHVVEGPTLPSTGQWADVYDDEECEEGIVGAELKRGRWVVRRMARRGDESVLFVFNTFRNNVIAKAAVNGGRVVILYVRKEHAVEIAVALKRMNVIDARYVIIDGSDEREARNAAKTFLLEHKDGIVLASGIWRQGVDVPWIETLIIAGAGVSTTSTIQKLGRSTRKHAGTDKGAALVVDCFDVFARTAEKQARKRASIYSKRLGFDVKVIGADGQELTVLDGDKPIRRPVKK